ncbi:MAG: lysophospholipid acyltransferase family protein [Syntrophobacteraceae bacterium]
MRTHLLDKPLLYHSTSWVARRLPKPVLHACTRLVGALVFLLSSRDRSTIEHNLRIILEGTVPPSGVSRLAWRVFQNYAFYMVDFFRLLTMSRDESMGFTQLYEGREHLDEALSQGRGVLLLTAHLGHWEIGGLGLSGLGYPVSVVAARHNSVLTNDLVNSLRQRHSIRVIELGESVYDTIELVHALKRGEVLAVLGDRVFNDRSRQVPLFGRPVSLPIGPVLLAMATRAPVVPAFSVMDAPGRYRGIIEAPLDIRYDRNREEAMSHNLGQVAAVFERIIRRYPDQWYHVERI